MHSTADIKSARYVVACRMISENMGAAILKATDAVVTVTVRQSGKWTMSGQPAAVAAALPVMRLAGMKVESADHDEELDETFVYLTE